MVLMPRIGREFVQWESPTGDEALGLVAFSICPDVNGGGRPGNTMAKAQAEAWAAGL